MTDDGPRQFPDGKQMVELDPPGTYCLNNAFFHLVDSRKKTGCFLELGPGEGKLSGRLCEKGWQGVGVDFSRPALDRLEKRLKNHIQAGKYRVINGDFNLMELDYSMDLVFCMMVLEHIEDDLRFLKRMADCTKPGGVVVIGAPARMSKWGVEDEISGHYRRYERGSLARLFQEAGLEEVRVWSIGVPVSNLLMGLSNLAIKRDRLKDRQGLSKEQQTRLSGLRDVPYKNLFPPWARFLLNPAAMWPVVRLQKIFYNTNIGLSLLAAGTKIG